MINGNEPGWLAVVCWALLVLTTVPVSMAAINLPLFRRPALAEDTYRAVSVIVPVRNEENSIADCLMSLRMSTSVELEVIVVDDHSTDRTASIVGSLVAVDRRIRLHSAPPLPPGWSGKQHACYFGASLATHPNLMFMDCDVRVTPAAVAVMAGFLSRSDAPLVSGFPRERTGTIGEAMLIPLIHLLLLGYLPILAMRLSRHVGFGAGCGQIMLADAASYRHIRGHELIRSSWHDGLSLPRAFRRCGYLTDIFDATDVAECRMYHGFKETWRGFAKNAREGMAKPIALPIWTVLLGGGFVAPFLLLPFALVLLPWTPAVLALSTGLIVLLLVRLIMALRFRQSLISVLLLPFGVTVLLVLQWCRLLRRPSGLSQVWRGRTQFSQ